MLYFEITKHPETQDFGLFTENVTSGVIWPRTTIIPNTRNNLHSATEIYGHMTE
jgi:hypothetical protein